MQLGLLPLFPILQTSRCVVLIRQAESGAFRDGKSALMLAAARLRHVVGTNWGMRRYLDMNRLAEASEAA